METVVIKLPPDIVNAIRRRAEEEGTAIKDLILEYILNNSDNRAKAITYIETAQELLRQAEEELRSNDLRQASEKIWSAATLSIKAYAYFREGIRLSSHGELWSYKTKVAKELGDWVNDSWNAANAMHTNFYEGWADESSISDALNKVKRLVEVIASIIRGDQQPKNLH